MAKSVAILGSGNLAFQLLCAFDKANVPLAGLISRDLSRGASTLEKTKSRCELVGGRDLTDLSADIIFLAVPDDSIQEVLKFYQYRPDQIIVHTSGAEPLDSVQKERCGVFYPLQTFTWGEAVDFSSIPILIEGSSISVEEELTELAQLISREVQIVSSANRLKIHLAAVLVSNFTNHLFHRADKWLKSNGLSFDVLEPLIDETIRKAKTLGPAKAQTGPAMRGDHRTMERHQDILLDESLRDLYRILSQDIKRIS